MDTPQMLPVRPELVTLATEAAKALQSATDPEERRVLTRLLDILSRPLVMSSELPPPARQPLFDPAAEVYRRMLARQVSAD